MKNIVLIATLGLLSLNTVAQEPKKEEGFVFSTVKENPITSIKNQNRSSTCWSFSSLAFLESELLRQGKGEYDLSEMFVVHHTMADRAERYVRLHGDNSFSPGGSFYDVVLLHE
jgi:C1A family cysteine protease